MSREVYTNKQFATTHHTLRWKTKASIKKSMKKKLQVVLLLLREEVWEAGCSTSSLYIQGAAPGRENPGRAGT